MACKSRNIRRPRRMSAGGILTSAGAGALSGSVAGPWGTAIGGAVGLGTGIMQHIQEGDAKKQQDALLQQQQFMQRQQNFNSGLQSNPQNIPLMPMGGLIPYNNETVELEKGEPFMTPDGQIEGISNNAPTHAQGGVPITLPSGTKVLGKKPATDEKTFKQLGSKLERQQTKYQKILDDKPSRIQEQTATRMLDKIHTQFNELFDLQGEDIQAGQQFQEGGTVTPNFVKRMTDPNAPFIQNEDGTRSTHLMASGEVDGRYIAYPTLVQQGDSLITPEDPFKYALDSNNYLQFPTEQEAIDYGKGSWKKKFPNGGMIRKGGEGLKAGTQYFAENPNQVSQFQKFAGITSDNIYGPNTMDAWQNLGQQYMNVQQGIPAIQGQPGTIPSTYQPEALAGLAQPQSNFGVKTPQQLNAPVNTSGNFNLGNALSTAGSLAPVAYNLAQGLQRPEQFNAADYYNPYEDQARSAMANRRFNIQPGLESNRLAQATYYRNLREGAPSQSQYLGGLQAGAIGKSRSDAALIAQQQNVNNQYLGEQAQFDARLGAQRAQTKLGVDQMNAQSRAAARGFVGTAATQVGQFAQNKQMMNSQMIRDVQRLNLLPALVQNYEYGQDGQWRFKDTGEVIEMADMMNHVKGLNIK